LAKPSRSRQPASAISLDSRINAWPVAAEVERNAHTTRSQKLVFSLLRDCLDPAECLLDPHCECAG
jgi:hypothetical protein